MEVEDNKPQCTFVKEEIVASGKWLNLCKITYTDPSGKERLWEAVNRTTKVAPDQPDAVSSIPVLKRALHYDCVVMVKQYRPPLKAYTLEFPAGLLDPKETIETCALRELKEETGYVGKIKTTFPASCLDPGVGNATLALATVEIDGDLPENQNPVAAQDEGEFTEVVLIPKDEMLHKLNEFSAAGIVVDSRVYMYAVAADRTTSSS